jgi:3-hydroxy-9,10-secoandrosta-1,3,5(10)-triene-9,17-dione monooxygenase reductase component
MRRSVTPAEPEAISFRSVLRHFPTGVVALTGLSGSEPIGMAVNSFTSVSLEPPLILFCAAHTSTTWPRLRDTGRICVNILSEHQRELSDRFAFGGDRFRDVTWSPSPAGLPVLDGAVAWLEGTVEAVHPAGDHDIVVARVQHLDTHTAADPLVFCHRRYGRLAADA